VAAGGAARRRDLERVGRGDPPAAAAAPVAVGDETDHVRARRRRLDERLLEDLVRLGRERVAAMRAARERRLDPAVDRFLRRPDAASPPVPALPARPLRRRRALALRAGERGGAARGASFQLLETPPRLGEPGLERGDPLRLSQHQVREGGLVEGHEVGAVHPCRKITPASRAQAETRGR
jgi:hypothetical protein